jgi:hypothetical protein
VWNCLEVFRELSGEKTGAVFISALSGVNSLLDLLDLVFAQRGDSVEFCLFFCDFSAGPVGAASSVIRHTGRGALSVSSVSNMFISILSSSSSVTAGVSDSVVGAAVASLISAA